MLRLFARNHGNARNVRTDAEESRMERPEQTPVTARADAVSNIFLFLDGKNVGNTYSTYIYVCIKEGAIAETSRIIYSTVQ